MKIAFVFPGYGSQFVGMAKELYDEFRIVQEYFEEASQCLNVNFVKLCFASSDAELAKLPAAYTATFLVSSAVHALLKQEGIEPTITAGHNQGEYAALSTSGCFTLPDGLYLLNKYGTILQEMLDTSDFRAIRVDGLTASEAESLCLKASKSDHPLYIALYYSENSQLLVGDSFAIAEAEAMLDEMKNGPYKSAYPEIGLHSPLMKPVVDTFKMYLEKVDFKDLAIPMIESVEGGLIKTGAVARDYILKQMSYALQWSKVMEALDAFDVIITICPGDAVKKMLVERYPEKKILSINKRSDIEEARAIIQEKQD